MTSGVAAPSVPMISVGSPAGGGMNAPMRATTGRSNIMLKSVGQGESVDIVVVGHP